jgi:HSP20 family molecular chaperone IbpA
MIGAGNRNGKSLARRYGYPMRSLFDEMNRFFEDAVPVAQSVKTHGAFRPHVDVTETEKEYIVHGEFPGLSPSEVALELRDNTLTLSGEK